jgi:hypothetical protein
MMRPQDHNEGGWSTARISFGSIVVMGLTIVLSLVACAPKLPEPESKPAKLYVQYCAGAGCHDPIPPQRDSIGYWNSQYDRMIVLMRDKGMALPNAEEDRLMREYLEKYASR